MPSFVVSYHRVKGFMLISIPLLQLIESSTCMSIHVKDALFISLSVWVDNCHLTSNGFSTQFVAFVFWTSRSISRCSQIHVPSLAEITVFRLKSPEIKKNLRTCIGPVIGPLALLQCQTWRLWSSATKTRCLKQSATAPACVSCTCQL